MELKGLHSATPWWRERKWGGKNEREGWGGGGGLVGGIAKNIAAVPP